MYFLEECDTPNEPRPLRDCCPRARPREREDREREIYIYIYIYIHIWVPIIRIGVYMGVPLFGGKLPYIHILSGSGLAGERDSGLL